jgi:pyruvate kinase
LLHLDRFDRFTRGSRPATGRKLAMAWGLHCVLTNEPANQAEMVEKACKIALDEGFAGRGERIIITAGVPLAVPGTTNMLRIAYVGDQPGQKEQAKR